MLDKSRLEKRLLAIERYSSRLSKIVPKSSTNYSKGNFEMKAAVERHLQLISDLELEVSLIIYKWKESSLAGEENSLLDSIEEVIGKDLAGKIRIRRSLRNRIIHAYSDFSYDSEVYEQAKDLSDVSDLTKKIRKVVKSGSL